MFPLIHEGQCTSSHDADTLPSVQLLLGRCLLKLQEYELLLKRILVNTAFSGSPADVRLQLAEKSFSLRKKMMGELVGMLANTFLTSAALDNNSSLSSAHTNNVAWVETRMQFVFSEERYIETRDSLKELVSLRNELVHHFISKFNLSTSEGCAAAEAFLNVSYAKIDENHQLLKAWRDTLVAAQAKFTSLLDDPMFQCFLDGICPDGTVDWPRAGIVQGLRDAEGFLAINGWTSLSAAIEWVSKNSPEQRPSRYGCSSWRQVLHESRQFDVRKREPHDHPGVSKSHPGLEIWFRSRRRADVE